MSFKPFFVHINPNNPGNLVGRRHRAVTLYVSPNEKDSRMCLIRKAACSKHDAFVKATGRVIAQAAEPVSINKRDLPKVVAQAHHDCWRIGEEVEPLFASNYNHLLRNFL